MYNFNFNWLPKSCAKFFPEGVHLDSLKYDHFLLQKLKIMGIQVFKAIEGRTTISFVCFADALLLNILYYRRILRISNGWVTKMFEGTRGKKSFRTATDNQN